MTRNGLKRLWKCLRDSRKHQKVFRGTCGVPGIRRDVCAGRASIPAFAETFAQVARGSRHLPRRLRRLRKFHGIYRDVCAGRARLPAFAETFAQAARGSRHLPRRLHRLREAPGIRRDVCGAPANAKKFFGTLAAFLQTPKSFSRLLQRCCKTFSRGKTPHAFVELTYRRGGSRLRRRLSLAPIPNDDR